MNKQKITKIIEGVIIFVFVVSIFQFSLSVKAAVVNDNLTVNISELFKNPNVSKDSAYKFSLKILKSGVIQNVIGCTGIVNKAAKLMSQIVSPVKTAEMLADKVEKYKELLKSACANTKAVAETAGQSVPTIGGLAKPIDTIISKVKIDKIKACMDQVENTDPKLLEAQVKANEKADEIALKDSCFDGIAIMLARNQLTSMTRSAMNWVNTGYGGNPFFVQNMTNFTNNIERNVLQAGINILVSSGNENPYARNFAQSVVSYGGVGTGSLDFLGNLGSDLGLFITDPQSLYPDEEQDPRTALQKAQYANNTFSNDFSTGGWEGWLALTQRDQNNPLGFTMLASQYLADQQEKEVAEKKEELAQNNGFLSQKKCILWQVYDEKGKPKYKEGGFSTSGLAKSSFDPITQTKPPTTCYKPGGDCCVDWEIITPGSIIKEQTANYLASPQRQLEMVKTINDGINALFSYLISKLEDAGLAGLSDSVNNSSNWVDDTNWASSDGNTSYDNNGAYDNFNLIRDLGNKYIHSNPTELGVWNAKTNKTDSYIDDDKDYDDAKLYKGTAPTDIPAGKSAVNSHYKVTTPGNTELLLEGYNGWNEGDRAFWDGKKWQNWKKGQENPIKERGVIQIQQDYIVAATEILKVLPGIMPKLGELDYCIPGPNPSYKTNSTDAQSAYQDWVGSMYVGTIDNTGNRHGVKIDKAGDSTYDNLHNIFADNPNVWKKVLGDKVEEGSFYSGADMQFILDAFSNICSNTGWENFWGFLDDWWKGESDDDNECIGNYFYSKNPTKLQAGYLDNKKKLMELNLDYVNSSLFQNFYEVFDKMMNKLYFNNITSPYFENELTSKKVENTGYIPMAESGLDLTKNMLYYNDDIETISQEYRDSIAMAKINIAKLEPIKAEVSEIIKAAQDRRTEELLKIVNGEICNENYTKCMRDGYNLTKKEKDTLGGRSQFCNRDKVICDQKISVTNQQLTEYKKTYAKCLAEEDVQVFDVDSIMDTTYGEAERCSNEIDDDLDGLIDMKDPDCFGVTPVVHCVRSGVSTPITGRVNAGRKCSDMTNSQGCNLYQEYESGLAWQCEWIPSTPPDNTFSISDFKASPATITKGQPTTLSWSTSGATSVTISNLGYNVPTSGTQVVYPTQTTIYTLTATSPTNTTLTKYITVSVGQSNDTQVITKWKTDMTNYISRIQADLPGAIVVMTEFQDLNDYTLHDQYDTAIKELAKLPNVYSVSTKGYGHISLHWTSQGLKDVAKLMVSSLPTISSNNLAFVITGESNAVGLGSTSNISTFERTSRPEVQILTSSSFENLNIETNNQQGSIVCVDGSSPCHGFEIGIANEVTTNGNLAGKQVYIVKTGVGGTKVSDWINNGSSIWATHIYKTAVAKRLLSGKNPQWVVLLSIGLNDAKANN